MKPKTEQEKKIWRDNKIAWLREQIDAKESKIDELKKAIIGHKNLLDFLESIRFIKEHQITKDQVLTEKEYGYVGTVYDLKDKLEGWKWVEWNERIYPTEKLFEIFNSRNQSFWPSSQYLKE